MASREELETIIRSDALGDWLVERRWGISDRERSDLLKIAIDSDSWLVWYIIKLGCEKRSYHAWRVVKACTGNRWNSVVSHMFKCAAQHECQSFLKVAYEWSGGSNVQWYEPC
jgi:hypothetical protein